LSVHLAENYCMKKITLLFFSACLLVFSANAQIPKTKDLTKSIPSTFDVNGLTKSLMGELSPKLSLTDKQSPLVQNTISKFLGDKSKILPLMKTDPAGYTSKFGSLFSGLKTSLGGILLKDQMNKFLGLKPKTNDPANVLSNLFF